MQTPPFEVIYTEKAEIACDGGAHGHPRVFLHIESETGNVVCPYCSRTYVLKEGQYVHLSH